MSDKFAKLGIERYAYFDLFLHMNQFPFVGRCYAWALREDAEKVTNMRKEEVDELFGVIIPDWSSAIYTLYNQSRDNVAIFGNGTSHLHAHFIPRYDSPIRVHGIEFVDPNPNGNYSPYPKKEVPENLLLEIRDDIKRTMEINRLINNPNLD